MKTTLPAKLTVIAFLVGGVSCWPARAGDVTENWNANCAACHGKDGKGQTKMGPKLGVKDFTDAKFQGTFDDAQAAKAIKEGITKNDSLKMKAFGDKFSDDEIKARVAHVRSFKQ